MLVQYNLCVFYFTGVDCILVVLFKQETAYELRISDWSSDVCSSDLATTAESNFDPNHPLYRAFARLAKLRQDHVALRRGRQLIRSYAEKPGLFAVSRIDAASGAENVLAFNTPTAPLTVQGVCDPVETRNKSPHDDYPAQTAVLRQSANNHHQLGLPERLEK